MLILTINMLESVVSALSASTEVLTLKHPNHLGNFYRIPAPMCADVCTPPPQHPARRDDDIGLALN